MRTAKEYVELFAESLDWEELITTIQKEAWNEAVEACAETATAYNSVPRSYYDAIVDRQSILKNKI